MESTAQNVEFGGQWAQNLKRLLLYLTSIACSLSFVLMGANCVHVIVFFFVVSAPIVLLYLISSFFLDRFSFHAIEGDIVRPLRRSISYNKVKAFYLTRRRGSIKVCVKQRWPWKTTLVRTLDVSESENLREELRKSFPHLTPSEKRSSDLRILIGIISGILLMGFLYHAYFYYHYPELRTSPKLLEVDKATRPEKNNKAYRLRSYTFSLPKQFKEEKKEGEDALRFSDTKSKIITRVVYISEKEKMSRGDYLFYYGTGMKDYFDLLLTVYPARIGMLPLTIKGVILGDLKDFEIYEIRHGNLTGFIMQGNSNKGGIAHVILKNNDGRDKINFFLSGPNAIQLKTVKTIADSVQAQ